VPTLVIHVIDASRAIGAEIAEAVLAASDKLIVTEVF
jgi:hypothetical protein